MSLVDGNAQEDEAFANKGMRRLFVGHLSGVSTKLNSLGNANKPITSSFMHIKAWASAKEVSVTVWQCKCSQLLVLTFYNLETLPKWLFLR